MTALNPTTIKILVIEDEEPIRLTLKTVLEEEGYSIGEAETGARALELIRQSFFDIWLVDYRLPDMNGLDLIKQALEISKDSIPVIVTGCSSIEIAVEGMRAGTHDYMIKPVNIDELKKNIETILKEREELRQGKARFPDVIKTLRRSDDMQLLTIVNDLSGGGARAKIDKKPSAITDAMKHMFYRIKGIFRK